MKQTELSAIAKWSEQRGVFHALLQCVQGSSAASALARSAAPSARVDTARWTSDHASSVLTVSNTSALTHTIAQPSPARPSARLTSRYSRRATLTSSNKHISKERHRVKQLHRTRARVLRQRHLQSVQRDAAQQEHHRVRY